MTESMSDEWVEEFQQKWTQEQAQDFDPNLFNDLANSNSSKGHLKKVSRFLDRAIQNGIKKVINGEVVNIKIYIDQHEVLFEIPFSHGKRYKSLHRVRATDVSEGFITELRAKRSDLIQPTIKIKKELLQTFNPIILAGGKATVRWKGGVASLKDLKEIGDERLLHHAPLLFDLIYFYQKHRNNPQRINVTELEGEPVITLKARSVYDLTSVQSQDAAEGVKRELVKLTKVHFHLIYETDSSLKRKKGKGVYKVSQITSKNTFSPFLLRVDINPKNGQVTVISHQFLTTIENHYRHVPADIRSRWNRWKPQSKITHAMKLASGWSWMQRRNRVPVRVGKFLQVCDLQPDIKNPKRLWERLQSVLKWLQVTLEISRYQLYREWDKKKQTPVHETNDFNQACYIVFQMERATHPYIKGILKENEDDVAETQDQPMLLAG